MTYPTPVLLPLPLFQSKTVERTGGGKSPRGTSPSLKDKGTQVPLSTPVPYGGSTGGSVFGDWSLSQEKEGEVERVVDYYYYYYSWF